MFCIIELNKKQYKIYEKNEIIVPKINNEIGNNIIIGNIILISNNLETIFDKSYLKNWEVALQIVDHIYHKKINGLKKRRRKNSRNNISSRQKYTILKVISINKIN